MDNKLKFYFIILITLKIWSLILLSLEVETYNFCIEKDYDNASVDIILNQFCIVNIGKDLQYKINVKDIQNERIH